MVPLKISGDKSTNTLYPRPPELFMKIIKQKRSYNARHTLPICVYSFILVYRQLEYNYECIILNTSIARKKILDIYFNK